MIDRIVRDCGGVLSFVGIMFRMNLKTMFALITECGAASLADSPS